MSFYFWLWAAVAVASIVLEAATLSALVSIWFAFGALCAMIVAIFNDVFWIQLTVFMVVSLVLAMAIRPITRKLLRGTAIPTNADRLIGMRTKLISSITDDHLGTLKAGGLIWNAISANHSPIDKGTEVEILSMDGNKLIVKEIK
ncbi:MAG: NfeD family protein [Erysipelotrichaceae bacterium]|nr:NfeD family protein [Erysipelotrichaceae bacterium]